MAKYPFLEGTKQFLLEKKIEVDELPVVPAYARVREAGKDRVLRALREAQDTAPLAEEADQLVGILSYPLARELVSCIPDEFLIRRYSYGEALRSAKTLETEKEEILDLVSRDLGLDFRRESENYHIHYSDFLRNTSRIRDKSWKLVNQTILRGYVKLTRLRFVRVLQNAINRKVEGKLPVPITPEIERALRPQIEAVALVLEEEKRQFAPKQVGPVRVTRFPPCMRKLLAAVQGGENVSHQGRFALTTFLHAIGLGNEEIFRVYSAFPDFDERMTRYQVEHITGVISSTEYSTPECATMKSYGICPQVENPDDPLCQQEWMNHPLTYYRIKGKPRRTEPSEAEEKKKP